MNEKIVADTIGYTREGPGTVALGTGPRNYFIGPNGISVQRGKTRKRLSWHEIAALRRIVGHKINSAKLEFVARQRPPKWLPMFAIEHIPLHWLTTVIALDPKLCGTSDAAIIDVVRRFAPGIRVYTIYRKRIIIGDLDGPDIQSIGTTGSGGDGTGSGGD